MLHDYEHAISTSVGEAPQVQTNADTAFVSEIIDCANCQGVTFVGLLGTLTDANVTWAVTIDEGDASNLSDAAACSTVGSNITRTLPSGNYGDDLETFQIGYIGSKRYCRLTLTPTGNNSGDFPFALCVIKHGLRVMAA